MNKNKQTVHNRESTAGGFFAGVMIGGLAGAGAMLLLAPQSGRRTRAKIQHQAVDLGEQASEAVTDAANQVRAKADQISADISNRAEDVQQRGQALLNNRKDRVAIEADRRPKATH